LLSREDARGIRWVDAACDEVRTVRQMLRQERGDPIDALGVDQVVEVEDDGPLPARNGGEIVYQRADQRFDLWRFGLGQRGDDALPHAPLNGT
jgi:hypothetical protein